VRRKGSAANLTLELPFEPAKPRPANTGRNRQSNLADEILAFEEFGAKTVASWIEPGEVKGLTRRIPRLVNEFWTARQRQASSLHEVSYRACFKPQLPRFFIERLTIPGDLVYDPFMGRGTTPLEASLLDRVPCGCDANPLSLLLLRPRLTPPTLRQVADRLAEIDLRAGEDFPEDLLVFYHPETLRQITALRGYLRRRRRAGQADKVDEWIAMVATNRLTGHSNGFFSVYTMPPNQAVSAKSQRKINERRGQTPPARDVPKIILKKSKQLLGDVAAGPPRRASEAILVNRQASHTPEIPSGSVQLVVTSPPFLNVVDYAGDNWLRCWFAEIDPKTVRLTLVPKLDDWAAAMTEVFREIRRVLKAGGHVAFEVGEVHAGMTKLDETVIGCATTASLEPVLLMINAQEFTKTANCWGVTNNEAGTNSNRIVVLRKP
jgi:hypothetical protein